MTRRGAGTLDPVRAPLLEPWRPDLETYHRLGELGVFEDQRVELLDGVITQMSPKSREHEVAIAYLNRLAVEATPPETAIYVQLALSLGERWEPEPDLAVIEPGTPRPYHPASAALVVEVAASSLRHDLTVKAPLYGRSGIPECWVVDVNAERLVRFTKPSAAGYDTRDELREGRVSAVGVSGLEVDLAALWAAVRR